MMDDQLGTYKETRCYSLLKAISWRIVASITTTIIVLILFGKLNIAIFAGIIESIIKIILYYIHERIWYNIRIRINK